MKIIKSSLLMIFTFAATSIFSASQTPETFSQKETAVNMQNANSNTSSEMDSPISSLDSIISVDSKLSMNNKSDTQVCEIAPQSGGWLKLNKGELLRVTDVDGEQVADMFAVSADDMNEYLSVSATRASCSRMFPKLGDCFVSNKYNPMLTIQRDDSPGIHDMLYAVCSPEMYKAMGVKGYHPSCSENFRKAAAAFNWNPAVIPDPVNLFQNTKIIEKEMTPLPAATKAGDSITLCAEMNIYVIVTACSMDLEPINGEKCSRIKIEKFMP